MTLKLREHPLPYVPQLAVRTLDMITRVVIHCTELPDLATARIWSERIHYPSGTGDSGHYYIDRDGTIYRYVPDTRIAHHVRGFNTDSIGIELVNSGRYPNWFDSRQQTMREDYPETQITALRALLTQLSNTLDNLRHIAAHEDLDTTLVVASDDARLEVVRKCDPGPLFPWDSVLSDSHLKRQFKA